MTKRIALAAMVLAALAIAAAYAAAFLPGGAPGWAAWLMALGIPTILVGVMVLGAAREGRIGKLALPFAFSFAVLAAGFCLAVALPEDAGAGAPLYLGLPLRAAIVIYGIGLFPIVVLPIAYALTFGEQTLNAGDLERVRQAGEAWARQKAAAAQSVEPHAPSAAAEREPALPGARA